jgi:DNA-binding response OmpR family regulator
MAQTMFCARCASVQPVTPTEDAGGRSTVACTTCGAQIAEASRRVTILCIDDDPLVLHFYREFLGRHGYRTILVEDGARGIEIAKQEGPDVVLVDVMLRGFSGLDVCRQLRRESALQYTPIILVTALDNPQIGSVARDAGATVYVRKPSDPERIIDLIEHVLAERIIASPDESPSEQRGG